MSPELAPAAAAGQRMAVVGSGISGLAAAWLLARRHRVTLFEADGRLGGHTHTVPVEVDGARAEVDTGFLVFNRRTYPHLTAMLDHLRVPVAASAMSFSVVDQACDLEWAGSSVTSLFAQRSNLLRPEFWSMLGDILRFNREVTRAVRLDALPEQSLCEYLDAQRYGQPFRDWYLLPMAASIWSCPTGQMLHFPLQSLARFMHNHGLLQVRGRPPWLTVAGGARRYVDALAKDIRDIRLACPVHGLEPLGAGVRVRHAAGEEDFDHVVLACHSDQAAGLVPSCYPLVRETLERISYQPNEVVLHTDVRFLPRARAAWAAWNYRAAAGSAADRPVSLSYWLNALQPLPFDRPLVETLNPFVEPDPKTVLGRYRYSHPVFDAAAVRAQRLLRLARAPRLHFCGAWLGYGFHEDGLRSAVEVAERFGVEAPWGVAAAQAA
jgi:uncharacterized protein